MRGTVTAAIAGLALVFTASADLAPRPVSEQPNPPPTEGAAGMAGQFVFNQNDGGSRGCQVILDDQGSYGQFDVKLGDDCTAQFEFLDMVSGWVPKGDGFVILGAEGSEMIEMHPDKTGIYRGKNVNDERLYYMERTSG